MITICIIGLVMLLVLFIMVCYICVTWCEQHVSDEQLKRYFKEKYGNFNSHK